MVSEVSSYGDEGALGSVETVGSAGVFGQVMGLVAVTVGFFALGFLRLFAGGRN